MEMNKAEKNEPPEMSGDQLSLNEWWLLPAAVN